MGANNNKYNNKKSVVLSSTPHSNTDTVTDDKDVLLG